MKSSKLGGYMEPEDHLMRSLEDLITEAKHKKGRSLSKGARPSFQPESIKQGNQFLKKGIYKNKGYLNEESKGGFKDDERKPFNRKPFVKPH
jgi:hypothetical protein